MWMAGSRGSVGLTDVPSTSLCASVRHRKRIQAGAIVEEGTHGELYAVEDSVYRSLVQLQEQATDKREGGAPILDLEAAAAADEAAAESLAAEHAQQRQDAGGPAAGGAPAASPQVSAKAARGSGAQRRGSTRDSVPGPDTGSQQAGADGGMVSGKKQSADGGAKDVEKGEDELVRLRHACSMHVCT